MKRLKLNKLCWGKILCTLFLVFCMAPMVHGQLLDTLLLAEPSLEDLLAINITTASRSPEAHDLAPATIYVITAQDIQRNGYMELGDILENIPGITVVSPDFFQFGGQRGFVGNFSQTILMINGREVQNLVASETFISHQFATHNIKQVEIINGPGSALYGANALVGVINIITKNSSDDFNGTDIQMEMGSESTWAASIIFGQQYGDLKLSGSIRLYQSDEWDFSDFVSDTTHFSEGFDPRARGVIDETNRYVNQTMAIPLSLYLEYKNLYFGHESYYNKANKGIERVALDFNGQRDFRKFELTFAGLQQELGNHDLNVEYQHFKEWMWGVNYRFKDSLMDTLLAHNPGRDPMAQLTQTEIHSYFMDVYSQENSEGSSRDRIDANLTSTFAGSYNTIAGLSFERLDILSIAHAADDLYPYNDQRRATSESDKFALFLQMKKSLLDNKIHLTLGGRYDHHSAYGGIATVRSGLVCQPFEKTFIKGLFGQAFREPNIFELDGNTELTPAKINTYEFSVNHHLNSNIKSNIVLYRSDAYDLIAPSTSFVFVNDPDVRSAMGLEGMVYIKYNRFFSDIGFDFTQVEAETFAGEKYDALGIYPFKLTTGINYRFYNLLNVNTRLNYFPSIVAKHGNSDLDEVVDIASFTKLDINLSVQEYDFDIYSVSLNAKISNALDGTFYHPNVRRGGPKYFLQPGRQYMLKLSIFY